jgi:hypothetical protein
VAGDLYVTTVVVESEWRFYSASPPIGPCEASHVSAGRLIGGTRPAPSLTLPRLKLYQHIPSGIQRSRVMHLVLRPQDLSQKSSNAPVQLGAITMQFLPAQLVEAAWWRHLSYSSPSRSMRYASY